MAQVIDDGTTSGARSLAKVAEPFHGISYYSPEMLTLHDEGYRGWWHAYFGYRPAPMGPVPANVVTATFYNFAPRMVEKAVPGVWAVRSPAAATARRLELVAAAIHRIFGPGSPGEEVASAHVAPALELARRAIDGCPVPGRPLYGAYAELPWPDDPALALWHACTLLREYRGDSHVLALGSSELDGVECHVMMAARGHGNRPTILSIRGWTDDEWDAAVERLAGRGWVTGDGSLTDAGREGRSAVERLTDRLAGAPAQRLGSDDVERLVVHLGALVEHLLARGEVAGRWPPDHLMKQ